MSSISSIYKVSGLLMGAVLLSACEPKAPISEVPSPAEPEPPTPPELVAQRTDNEFIIDGATYHPLGDDLVVRVQLPEGASAENPVPACAIFHGSGGLFKQIAPNTDCSDEVENDYQSLADFLNAEGVAAVLPSSFYSRNSLFCEDKKTGNVAPYLAFAGQPFFTAASEDNERDTPYFYRRVAARAMDALATMNFMCDLPEVDCEKTCMVGTSNGGTTIMSYVAQDVHRHLPDYTSDQKRYFEYNSNWDDRLEYFANFPQADDDLADKLQDRPLPKFAQLISPGCSLRNMVPNVDPGEEAVPEDLYYPAANVDMLLEIGSEDSIPDSCHGEGFREVQARAYEELAGIDPEDSRYRINIHEGGQHSLLGTEPFGTAVRDNLLNMINTYLK